MIWYIVVATFLFYGYFSYNPERYYKISMLVLFAFTAFRNIHLGDYENTTYMSIYNNAPFLQNFLNTSYDYETGFTLLMSISKTILYDFRLFQVLYTLIALILLHFVIKNLDFEDRDKNLFLFVYFTMRFVINNFIILRQNIANLLIWNLVLSSVGLIITILIVFFAAQFHVTSYMNLFTIAGLHVFSRLDRSKVFRITLITSVILLALSNTLVDRMILFFSSVTDEKYQRYLLSEGGSTAGFNFIYYILRIAFFVLFYMFYDTIEYEKKDKVFLISAVAVILGSVNAEIFSRFMEFFMVGCYAEITLSYRCIADRSKPLYLFVLYIALMVIMIRQLLIYGGGYLLDYYWFFGQG